MTGGARRLFVYYSVAEASLGPALANAGRLQAQLKREWPDLVAELLRRPGSKDGQVTLMETYQRPGGLSLADEARIAALADELGAGRERHVEAFEPLP
jgi:Domain of unknown function (DUF4936)